jgi:hypothetical protein
MQVDKNTFIEVSDALEMGNPAIVEKDYYVVALLKLLSEVSFTTHLLVFSGGTALSKSGINIHRMSEDVDIKMIPQHAFESFGSRNSRKRVRKQNHIDIIKRISGSSFFSIEGDATILDEYRYQVIDVRYPQSHKIAPCLRPFIKLELIETCLYDDTQNRSIASLAAKAYQESAEINVMAFTSILSTQTEKIISMLRRTVSYHRDSSRGEDPALIRHIYDTFYIQQAGVANVADIIPLIKKVIVDDVERFGNQHPQLVENPICELRFALKLLEESSQFEDRFNQYVVPMVYGRVPITWVEAFGVFKNITNAVLDEIDS